MGLAMVFLNGLFIIILKLMEGNNSATIQTALSKR